MVAHACNHSTFGGQSGWIASALEMETNLGNEVVKLHFYKKNFKKKTSLARHGG